MKIPFIEYILGGGIGAILLFITKYFYDSSLIKKGERKVLNQLKEESEKSREEFQKKERELFYDSKDIMPSSWSDYDIIRDSMSEESTSDKEVSSEFTDKKM